MSQSDQSSQQQSQQSNLNAASKQHLPRKALSSARVKNILKTYLVNAVSHPFVFSNSQLTLHCFTVYFVIYFVIYVLYGVLRCNIRFRALFVYCVSWSRQTTYMYAGCTIPALAFASREREQNWFIVVNVRWKSQIKEPLGTVMYDPNCRHIFAFNVLSVLFEMILIKLFYRGPNVALLVPTSLSLLS